MTNNKYSYEAKGGKHSGYFNIYQARNGKIMLVMGNKGVLLTIEQVKGLPIDLYDLKDFDHDLFMQGYLLFD